MHTGLEQNTTLYSVGMIDPSEKVELIKRSEYIFANYAKIHHCEASRIDIFFLCPKQPYCEYYHQRQFLMDAVISALADYKDAKHTLAWCDNTFSILLTHQSPQDLQQIILKAIKHFNKIAGFYGSNLSSQNVDTTTLYTTEVLAEALQYN